MSVCKDPRRHLVGGWGIHYSFNKAIKYLESIGTSFRTILDVGAGAGFGSDTLRSKCHTIEAIEGYKEGIELWNLHSKYDMVHACLLQDFKFEHKYDFALMSDILEHVTIQEAQDFLKKLRENVTQILVVVPYESANGRNMVNPLEYHKQPDLTEAVMKERYPELQCINSYLPNATKAFGYFIWKDSL